MRVQAPSICAAQPEPGKRLLHADGDVAEVRAARALQQVAAHGRQVADLRRCPGQQRLGERGKALANQRVRRDVAVAGRGRDARPAGDLRDLEGRAAAG